MFSAPDRATIRRFQQSPPVQVVKLAHAFGIEVWEDTMPDSISGKLTRLAGPLVGTSGFAIFVNRSHSKNRQRFTVAHELGHYLLHRHKLDEGEIVDDTFFRSRLSNRLEAEANAAAAEILMPYHLLNSEARAGNKKDIRALSDIFKVSEAAMSIRLGVPA